MELADPIYDVFSVPIIHIWADHTFNCRNHVTRESVTELSEQIEADGLQVPIILQPIEEVPNAPDGFKYRLVCGFRRYTALKMLGWTNIPSTIRTGLSERQIARLNFSENIDRKDLNLLEQAQVIDKLYKPYHTDLYIAKDLNKEVRWVKVRRNLLMMSDYAQKVAASGRISESDLRYLQKESNADVRIKALIDAKKDRKKRRQVLQGGKRSRTKSEVKEVINQLLKENFNPQLLRLLGWAIGEVDDEGLKDAIIWLRDKKSWLK